MTLVYSICYDHLLGCKENFSFNSYSTDLELGKFDVLVSHEEMRNFCSFLGPGRLSLSLLVGIFIASLWHCITLAQDIIENQRTAYWSSFRDPP